MGSTTFYRPVNGTADPDEAFSKAHDEDAFEFGHGGYTGTIAEKHEYVVITRAPLTTAEADRLAAKLIDAADPRVNDKWGPAGAIALTDKQGKSRTVTVTVTVDGDSPDKDEYPQELAEKAAAGKAKPGETVTHVEVLSDTAVHKVEAARTNGKNETVYHLYDSRGHVHGDRNGYPTVAAARAAAVDILNNAHTNFGSGETDLGIRGTVRRDTGDNLVTVRRVLRKRTVKAKVTLTTPPAGAKVTGWLFFGWASC